MTYHTHLLSAVDSIINNPIVLLDEALASSSHKAMATKAANSTKNATGLTSAERISSEVMPSDRTLIPLERTSTPDKRVVRHLEKNGYSIAGDYKDGLAAHVSKPDRKIRIGKALAATDATDHIKAAFEKDPARQGIKSEEKASVLISRRSSDVAAMSTHQHWQSCQTLGGSAKKDGETVKQEKGSLSDQVPKIVASGAHIAYLVKHPDDVDKHYKPMARVTLNPFVSATSKHTILRPSNEYGESWEGFHSTVNKWAEKNFPAKDPEYHRHLGAYQEGASHFHNYGSEHDDYWKGKSYDVHAQENHTNPEVLKHYTDEAISDKKGSLMTGLMRNPALPKESADKIINHAASINLKSTPHAEHHVATITKNAKSPEHIQKMLNTHTTSGKVYDVAAQNDNTNAAQLHHILDTHGAKKTSEPNIRELSGNSGESIISSVVRNKNSNDSHFKKILEIKEFNQKESPHKDLRKTSVALDHHNLLTEIAGKYHDEDIGKKLINTVNVESLHSDTQHVVSSVAEKHPHLVHVLPDQHIQSAYRKCPLNKNLENEALRRGTPSLLSTVASHTSDRTLLGAMVNHSDDSISTPAKIRTRHLDIFS